MYWAPSLQRTPRLAMVDSQNEAKRNGAQGDTDQRLQDFNESLRDSPADNSHRSSDETRRIRSQGDQDQEGDSIKAQQEQESQQSSDVSSKINSDNVSGISNKGDNDDHRAKEKTDASSSIGE